MLVAGFHFGVASYKTCYGRAIHFFRGAPGAVHRADGAVPCRRSRRALAERGGVGVVGGCVLFDCDEPGLSRPGGADRTPCARRGPRGVGLHGRLAARPAGAPAVRDRSHRRSRGVGLAQAYGEGRSLPVLVSAGLRRFRHRLRRRAVVVLFFVKL